MLVQDMPKVKHLEHIKNVSKASPDEDIEGEGLLARGSKIQLHTSTLFS
jgi:hypothetical protein